MSTDETTTVPYDELVDRCSAPLCESSLHAGDARLVAESLVRAEAEGAPSHGVARLPALLDRLRNGVAAPSVELTPVRETANTAVFDANHGLGQLVAARAMRIALDRVKVSGLAAVLVRDSSHFGRAGHWASMGVDADVIGLAMSNASPRIVPGPGATPMLGNNPWSLAVPATPWPLVVDMANSVVAAGKIQTAAATGERIPDGWALDAHGRPTTDPQQALGGALLAAAGHKGWAVSLLVDVLTGVLGGGAFAGDLAPGTAVDRRHCSAQSFFAIDVATFIDTAEFRSRMTELCRRLRAAAGPDGRLPGERSARNLARSRQDGVRIPTQTLMTVASAVSSLGLSWPR